jgi:hypothetical protein
MSCFLYFRFINSYTEFVSVKYSKVVCSESVSDIVCMLFYVTVQGYKHMFRLPTTSELSPTTKKGKRVGLLE